MIRITIETTRNEKMSDKVIIVDYNSDGDCNITDFIPILQRALGGIGFTDRTITNYIDDV